MLLDSKIRLHGKAARDGLRLGIYFANGQCRGATLPRLRSGHPSDATRAWKADVCEALQTSAVLHHGDRLHRELRVRRRRMFH